jgi:hypothetical protein
MTLPNPYYSKILDTQAEAKALYRRIRALKRNALPIGSEVVLVLKKGWSRSKLWLMPSMIWFMSKLRPVATAGSTWNRS